MSKNNVNPNHYKVAGRARQGEDIVQARNKQKHAESLVQRRSEPGARLKKPAAVRGPTAASKVQNKRTAKKATRKASASQKRRHDQATAPGLKGEHPFAMTSV